MQQYRLLSTEDLVEELVLESQHYREIFELSPNSPLLQNTRLRICDILRHLASR